MNEKDKKTNYIKNINFIANSIDEKEQNLHRLYEWYKFCYYVITSDETNKIIPTSNSQALHKSAWII